MTNLKSIQIVFVVFWWIYYGSEKLRLSSFDLKMFTHSYYWWPWLMKHVSIYQMNVIAFWTSSVSRKWGIWWMLVLLKYLFTFRTFSYLLQGWTCCFTCSSLIMASKMSSNSPSNGGASTHGAIPKDTQTAVTTNDSGQNYEPPDIDPVTLKVSWKTSWSVQWFSLVILQIAS